MLVLSRKVNEGVTIEGVGTVKIIEIRGDKVRLGFDGFDRDTAIHRDEIWARIQEEKNTREGAGGETSKTVA